MAGTQAKIDFSSDASQVTRSMQSIERSMQAVTRRLEDVEKGSKKATDSTTSGLQRATNQAMQFAGSLVGVGSAVGGAMAIANQLKAEYDALLQRQRAAAGSQVAAGTALREARKAFAPDATMGAGVFDASLQNLAAKRGSTVETVAAVAQTAFSAKGDLSNASAMSAIETAVRLAPTDPSEGSTVAGRLLDVMKVSGMGDARAVAGFLQNVQQNSRITNMRSVGANLVPAINALVKAGDSPEQAAEVAATLNQLMADEEGSMTRTAVISMAGQLQDFLPSAAGTQARIAALQADPKLRAKFLGKASFEQASKNFIESLLSGDATSQSAYESARKNIAPLNAAMAGEFEKQIAFINSGKFQPLVDAAQRGAANVQARQLSDTEGGLRGQIRAELERTLAETHEGAILEGLSDWMNLRAFDRESFFQPGVNPGRFASQQLQAMIDKSPLSTEDRMFARQQLEVLQRLEKKFDALLNENKDQTDVMRSGGGATQRALPSAALRR